MTARWLWWQLIPVSLGRNMGGAVIEGTEEALV